MLITFVIRIHIAPMSLFGLRFYVEKQETETMHDIIIIETGCSNLCYFYTEHTKLMIMILEKLHYSKVVCTPYIPKMARVFEY